MDSDEAVRQQFATWDKDGDGAITVNEVIAMLGKAGIPQQRRDAMAKALMKNADVNGDGKISFEEFKAAMANN
ncbi:hypothetical protein Pelo_2706 [Pelomyxa schiedti]|nr:hypothetical protein Pelo_19270 [Pelomyxa schiedti]KAH3732666.1 hypothetical protein Pelo_16503 [Pelomyxa schiedti]KAH3765425.1 hypothetical protein Pelo_2706 [Pelomyxa schiedti]